MILPYFEAYRSLTLVLLLELSDFQAIFFYCQPELSFFESLQMSYFWFEELLLEWNHSYEKHSLHWKIVSLQVILLCILVFIFFAVFLSIHFLLKVPDRCQNSSQVISRWVYVLYWLLFSYSEFWVFAP